MSTDIAKSRSCQVFVVPETTPGTLVFPSAAHFICPAGDALLNQVPEYTDSKELADTLDIINQFPNAMPPADWSLEMYLRTSPACAAPQGEALLTALQGTKQAAGTVTAAINAVAGIDADDTEIPYDTLAGGTLPPSGVVTIGTEKIRYAAKTSTSLTGCTRGFNGTTAATHADDAAITLNSVVYLQSTTAPSVSIWIKKDWFVQFCSGCTVAKCGISLANEDAVSLSFSGQGMNMGIAGESTIATAATAGATSIVVDNAKVFSVGARIWNVTKDADNSGAGFAVTAVNVDTNTLTIGTAVPSGGWAEDDVIRGYLPDGVPIGTAVKGRDTEIYIDGVEGRVRTTDLSVEVPKSYLTDELGTEFPEEYVEDTRKITTSLNAYFKKTEVEKFYQGTIGDEVSVEIVFGDTIGAKASIFMPRCRITVPTIKSDGATVALDIPVTALGTEGEDSLFLSLE